MQLSEGENNGPESRGRHFRADSWGQFEEQPDTPAQTEPEPQPDTPAQTEVAELSESVDGLAEQDDVDSSEKRAGRESVIYSETDYRRAKANTEAELARQKEIFRQESTIGSEENYMAAKARARIQMGAQAKREVQERWEQKTPQEQQAEHDSLVAKLEEAETEKEFWDICQNREYREAIGQSEVRQLLDKVIVREADGKLAELEEKISGLRRGIKGIEAELNEPFYKRLGRLILEGVSDKDQRVNLEGYQTLLEQAQAEEGGIKGRHEYIMAKQRVDSERRGRERREYFANTPVEQMAQDNKELPSHYMQALRDRGEYTLDNILLFYNGAKSDNAADSYAWAARKLIDDSDLSDEEKSQLRKRVTAAVIARMHRGE